MISFNHTHFEDSGRKVIASRIDAEKQVVLSRITRINTLEQTEELAFRYSLLRSALDVLDFISFYTVLDSSRNFLCVCEVKVPTSYNMFQKVIVETSNNLLRRDPTSSERFNSTLFMVLHFINKIHFED